jgi:hypothetical protein
MGFKAAGKAAATVLPALLERESKKTKTPPDASAAAQPEVKSGGSRHLLKGALRKPIALWHENVAGTGGVGKNNSRPAPQNLAEVREYVASGLMAIVKAEPAMRYAQEATPIPMPDPSMTTERKQRSVTANRLMKELGEAVKNQGSRLAGTARSAWRKNAGRTKGGSPPTASTPQAATPTPTPTPAPGLAIDQGAHQDFATAFRALPKNFMSFDPARVDSAGAGGKSPAEATETGKSAGDGDLEKSQNQLGTTEKRAAELADAVEDLSQSLNQDLGEAQELSPSERKKQLALAEFEANQNPPGTPPSKEQGSVDKEPASSPKSVILAASTRLTHAQKIVQWKDAQISGYKTTKNATATKIAFFKSRMNKLDFEMTGPRSDRLELRGTGVSSPPPSENNQKIVAINFSGNRRFLELPKTDSWPNLKAVDLSDCPLQDLSNLGTYPKGCEVKVTYEKLGPKAKSQFDAHVNDPANGVFLRRV